MKKLILFAFSALCCLLLSGCEDDTNLGDRAVVEAAAIDYDGEYRVSALLFSSGGSGGNTVDASQENVIKVTGTGKTLSEAIDNISLTDGKRLYMSETKLLILGGGFERVSAENALNTLYYDLRCSLNLPVCTADSAEMLTDLQFTEGITAAEKPLAMIENAHFLGVSPKTTLLDLLADNAAGRATLVPRFKPAKNGRGMTSSEEGKTAVLSGSRYLRNGLLTDSFDEKQTAGALIAEGKTNRIALNYLHDGIEKTCEAYEIKLSSEERQGARSLTVSARFRNRSGGNLPDDERSAALAALSEIIRVSI